MSTTKASDNTPQSRLPRSQVLFENDNSVHTQSTCLALCALGGACAVGVLVSYAGSATRNWEAGTGGIGSHWTSLTWQHADTGRVLPGITRHTFFCCVLISVPCVPATTTMAVTTTTPAKVTATAATQHIVVWYLAGIECSWFDQRSATCLAGTGSKLLPRTRAGTCERFPRQTTSPTLTKEEDEDKDEKEEKEVVQGG